MADSVDVLSTLKLVYTIYALVAISLIAWYAYRITQQGTSSPAKKGIFWSLVFWFLFDMLTLITGLYSLAAFPE